MKKENVDIEVERKEERECRYRGREKGRKRM